MISDLPFLSYLGAFEFYKNSSGIIKQGAKQVTISKQYGAHLTFFKIQWPGGVFRVPDLFQWVVIATGSKHTEDIYKAPDNVLSSIKAIEEVSSIFESCSDFTSTHRHTATSS